MNNLFLRAALAALALAAVILSEPVHAQQTGQISCSQNAQYDSNANGLTRIFTNPAPASGRQMFICGYTVNIGATATNVRFSYGTGTNCGTGTTSLTPLWVLPIAGQIFDDAGIWHGLTVPPGNDLCIFTSAGNPVQAIIYFTFQ